MTKRLPTAASPAITVSLLVLAVLAYLGRSLVMLTSVGGIALAYWLTADRTIRTRILGIALGGIGASFAAELVHVVHHMVIQDSPDHGGFWVSAFLVGSINVVVMLPFLAWSWHRRERTADADA